MDERHRELEAVGERLAEQAARFDEIDAEKALADYHEEGGRKLDFTNGPEAARREDRRAYMLERLQDERAANEPEDNSDREYDLDNKQDRVDYMAARWNGAEFQDAESDDAA